MNSEYTGAIWGGFPHFLSKEFAARKSKKKNPKKKCNNAPESILISKFSWGSMPLQHP